MKGYRCSAIRGNEVIVVMVTPIVIMLEVHVRNEMRAALHCGLFMWWKQGRYKLPRHQ